ncbi:hypothetical protein HPP92_004833 [Vanilla planifolia]|uniref:Uncharacterized protein n=1 Tax=Vanilla planifolia TaxID=51239 RepID=A0A835VAR9_VANPL|nr:hypothetical protein HPP92_004833 [Vanilla planifolia]
MRSKSTLGSGGSRKEMESLTERRCAPRLAAEKSRNSSSQGGWAAAGKKLVMAGFFGSRMECRGSLEAIGPLILDCPSRTRCWADDYGWEQEEEAFM